MSRVPKTAQQDRDSETLNEERYRIRARPRSINIKMPGHHHIPSGSVAYLRRLLVSLDLVWQNVFNLSGGSCKDNLGL